MDYSGVRKEVIDNALPEMIEGRLDIFTNYINKRESVRLLKESGQPAPWTDDPILRDYRFTNVRRTDDRISKYGIEMFAENPSLSLYDKIMNMILFRAFNKPETSAIFQQPIQDWSDENLNSIDQHAAKLLDNLGDKYNQYGSAYFQSGLKGAWGVRSNIHSAQRMLDMMAHIRENAIVESIIANPTPLGVLEIIKSVKGIGGNFLSYQIWVDLTYIPELPLNEDHMTVAGPGCALGISMLVEDMDGMTPEELIFHIRDNQHALDLDIDFCLTVMDIENIFCEFSKYMKRTLGQNNRMRKYV